MARSMNIDDYPDPPFNLDPPARLGEVLAVTYRAGAVYWKRVVGLIEDGHLRWDDVPGPPADLEAKS